MRQSTLLRFLILSIFLALGLGGVSFFALREVNESSTIEARRNMILFIAQTVESGGTYAQTLQALHARSGRPFSGTNLWVFSAKGEPLARGEESPPPIAWKDLKKPLEPHDFVFHYGFFRLTPDFALVKLDTKSNDYLLIEFRPRRPPPNYFGGPAMVQIAFLFFIIAVSVLIAVTLISIYLRRKSKEARAVLARLEKGELSARFEIKRADEIGSLMIDFNRMASEIERLVHRVEETEMARKNLLEELSHDLRTPLTSLNTSVETLYDHGSEMPPEEQHEFISMVKTELGYFLNLIEDLFFIAAIGEPRYKKTTERINLPELLSNEIKTREKTARAQGSPIQWKIASDEASEAEATILGDPLLIQRLFKNALDNAAKHARAEVAVRLLTLEAALAILIENDGNGITDHEIACFGQRRKNRFQASETQQGVSLGLGSVIMKTILELHGGTFDIQRKHGASGTVLSIKLPLHISITQRTLEK